LQRRIGITTLYVTHDQVEAMTLGDRVAVLRDGRLQQVDDAQMLYDAPANVFVATFIGSPSMNVFRSRLRHEEDGGSSFAFGETTWIRLPADWQERHARAVERAGEELRVGLRPESFTLAGEADPRARCRVTVHAVEALGHETIVYFAFGAGDPHARTIMAARLPARIDVEPGATLELGMDTARVHVFDRDGEAL
ncbi:MAG: TOBE domain-containing protein, partial [Candidatus Eiseniibacteriota bacterium]